MTEFDVNRPPKSVADEIERCARAHGSVTALVVPWESTPTTLNMAVTLVKADGWAIEHTNLGTIRLTAAGAGTRVTALPHDAPGDDQAKHATLFERFGREVERRLTETANAAQGRSGGSERP